MEIVEPIEQINKYLQRDYGVFDDGRPRFRVVWADDQFEKRWVDHTAEGWPLLHPEVREMPKYLDERCKHMYILEQLSIVPETDKELTENTSYEPLWVFRDRFDNYLPPRFDVCKIIIDQMYMNKTVSRPPMKEDSQEVLQKKDQELRDVEQKLFGNETPVGDALAYGWGTSVPGDDSQTHLGGKTPIEKEKVH